MMTANKNTEKKNKTTTKAAIVIIILILISCIAFFVSILKFNENINSAYSEDLKVIEEDISKVDKFLNDVGIKSGKKENKSKSIVGRIKSKIILDSRKKIDTAYFSMLDHEKENYIYNDISEVLKDMESIDFDSLKAKYKKTQVRTKGINLYFDENGELIKDLRDILTFENFVITVNKSQFDTTIYGYEIEDNILNYTPIVTFPCSINDDMTRTGKFLTTSTYRWHEMNNGTWAQYCVRFDNKHLFHSALFSENKPDTLIVDSYNGINRKWNSGGCDRLRTGDAYYIYSINKYHTLVVVYESDKDLPYGRETFDELRWVPFYASESEAYKRRYDPTDPILKEENIKVKFDYEPKHENEDE